MVPIPGTASVAHLEENFAATGLALTDEHDDELSGSRRPLRRWALSR